MTRFGFYEFFAGGGMARLGLGMEWRCLLANDICEKKFGAYRENFKPTGEFICRDVSLLKLKDLQGKPTLAWASFPCQDLSLAGNQHGFNGARSSTFWPFWEKMKLMAADHRPIPIIVLENVAGALTSNDGADFRAIIQAFKEGDYRVGALVIDAVRFVPQSRPRLFIIAIRNGLDAPSRLIQSGPSLWHPPALQNAYKTLSPELKTVWIWWTLPEPPAMRKTLADIIDFENQDLYWHPKAETERLLGMMTELNRAKVREAQKTDRLVVGAVYKRTRMGPDGKKHQRPEVRFDGLSGCLRTPVGGSSRQTVFVVQGKEIRSRLLTPREAARLMGVDDTYILPENYNEAYHLMGDGLAVPVVSWIESNLLYPLALANDNAARNNARYLPKDKYSNSGGVTLNP